MDITHFPDSFWRGIANSGFVSHGHVLPDAFQFDKEIREDGFRELSINWNDDEGALTTALEQKKENGKKQFRGGVAKLEVPTVKIVLSTYFAQNSFSYERRPIEGNPYHGNLLISSTLDKQMRSLISSGLALVAGTNVVPQCDSNE